MKSRMNELSNEKDNKENVDILMGEIKRLREKNKASEIFNVIYKKEIVRLELEKKEVK